MASSLSSLPIDIPLTPEDRRRTEYAGGTPIVLPDGLPWRFYEPQAVVRDVRGEDGEVEHMIAWEFGGEGVDAETNDVLGRTFHRILAKIDRATNDADRACGYLEAAWLLLARNYVVGQAEFEELLLRGDPGRLKRLAPLFRSLVDDACKKGETLIAALSEDDE